MHKVIILKDEASLNELNETLAEEDYWVGQVSANPNSGAWLVVLTDTNPDELFSTDYEEDEELDLDTIN